MANHADDRYVGFQLIKLRKNQASTASCQKLLQVLHRQLSDTGSLFEAGRGLRGFRPKKNKARLRRIELRGCQEGSLSLPSLQPRGRRRSLRHGWHRFRELEVGLPGASDDMRAMLCVLRIKVSTLESLDIYRL